jgi:membrane-bound ClpP family serine protease
MDPLTLAIFLLALAVVLIFAELILPTHGVLGVLGGMAAAGSVIAFFVLGPGVGLAALLVMVIASPIAALGLLQAWPYTPLGKRLTLTAVTAAPARQTALALGQTGRTVTELRPLGECDFGDHRSEAVSELGIIPAGSTVQIVALEDDGRPVVRLASPATPA